MVMMKIVLRFEIKRNRKLEKEQDALSVFTFKLSLDCC